MPHARAMLNLTPLRERLNGPFTPFVIHLSDGRKVAVPHRDCIAIGKDIISIVDERDRTYTIDAHYILSIADLPPRRSKAAR